MQGTAGPVRPHQRTEVRQPWPVRAHQAAAGQHRIGVHQQLHGHQGAARQQHHMISVRRPEGGDHPPQRADGGGE
ncbi:hypothetical protein D641_0110835 [Brachybacterium muris UCD-AY4]|uniref:Uncharacterized protein n=1 Tax=Brachybacterium muris UCD-AY4 TaxID=1249481 RepID=A0A022KWS9_9MICO|nr:hypothetical protein D641_0110835 [Brachybacterium muris UCD-AY4]